MTARIAVHKFSSCDGCQLALLNLGPTLLQLAGEVELVHFAEAGPLNETATVDIALVEGSINTAHDLARIRCVRANAGRVIAIGACACAGGLQALRNLRGEAGSAAWHAAVYARPEYLDSLPDATAIAEHIHVDLELWGCPINSQQLLAAIKSLLLGVVPDQQADKVCLACKRRGAVCVMVTRGAPCLGPVTRTGCGALCPRFGRDCYGCYGPAEAANTAALARRLKGLGLLPEQIVHRFHHINSQAEPWRQAGLDAAGGPQDE